LRILVIIRCFDNSVIVSVSWGGFQATIRDVDK